MLDDDDCATLQNKIGFEQFANNPIIPYSSYLGHIVNEIILFSGMQLLCSN